MAVARGGRPSDWFHSCNESLRVIPVVSRAGMKRVVKTVYCIRPHDNCQGGYTLLLVEYDRDVFKHLLSLGLNVYRG